VSEDIAWEPKQAAFRDLVLLVLHRQGGGLVDEEGKATARLLEMCSVVQTSAAMKSLAGTLRLMEEEGLIGREINGRRTRSFVLKVSLSAGDVGVLETKEPVNLSICNNAGRPSAKHEDGDWLTPLYDDCVRALAVLQAAASKAKHRSGSLAVLNVTQMLRGAKFPKKRADEVRHYLKELGLAKATTRSEVDRHLWWWEIASKPVDRERLKKKATGDHAYGGFRRPPILEETKTTRRYAGTAPARLGGDDVGLVVVKRTVVDSTDSADSPSSVPEVLEVEMQSLEVASPAVVEGTSPVDFEELLKLAERLERELSERDEQIASKDTRIEELLRENQNLKLDHEKALRLLRTELQDARTQAENARAELAARANSLLTRLKQRWGSGS